MNKFYKSKKFKYGSSATAITVIVIAAVIVLNVVATALGNLNGWYTDLTSKNYYKLSEEFKAEFEAMTIDGEAKANFNFVLMMDEDLFRSYNAQTVLVYNTLREIAKAYDNVKIKAINSTTHPELVERYKFAYGDTVSITDVVLELADEDFEPVATVSPKKYGINAFFTLDGNGNLYGFNAEARILSAFCQMLGKDENRPVAFYLQGHGEPALSTVDTTWVEILETAGYQVQEINLLTDDFSDYYDINAAGDCNNCVVIMNDPKFDLYVPAANESGISEVKKLREFLATNYGNIIVTVDSTTPDLPALKEVLSEWGLGYGGAVEDARHSLASSDASKLTADYSLMTDGLSALMKKDIFGSQSTSVSTVFESPAAVLVHDSATISSHGYNGVYGSYPLIYPYSSASVSIDYPASSEACFIGMAYSEWDLNDDEGTRSYALVIGSTEFLSESYANTTMNRKIMYWILSQIYDEIIYFENVNFIPFTNGTTLTVTDKAATAWTVSTIVVVPVIAAVVGTIVWIRRRHS